MKKKFFLFFSEKDFTILLKVYIAFLGKFTVAWLDQK